MDEPSTSPGHDHFVTTHWSVVLTARDMDSSRAEAALERLCKAYWYPLYAFVRRRGYSPHDAQDLTQEYFARLLSRDFLARVGREKGKFRAFLLASMKHFLANEWDRAQAAKRGGGIKVLSLDDSAAESRYALEPPDTASADKLFERRWATTLLDQVIGRLREEHVREGKQEAFEALKGALTGSGKAAPYAEAARRLGLTEGAVKVAVHRLRARYRELLRAEIAQTVASPDQVEDEIRHLFNVLGNSV